MACCDHCNVELVAGYKGAGNWNPTYAKIPWKICKPCYNNKYLNGSKGWNLKNNPKRMYVNGKYIPKSHPLYKPGKYKTFSDAAFDGTYKLESIKEGYVYAITNPAWLLCGFDRFEKECHDPASRTEALLPATS